MRTAADSAYRYGIVVLSWFTFENFQYFRFKFKLKLNFVNVTNKNEQKYFDVTSTNFNCLLSRFDLFEYKSDAKRLCNKTQTKNFRSVWAQFFAALYRSCMKNDLHTTLRLSLLYTNSKASNLFAAKVQVYGINVLRLIGY